MDNSLHAHLPILIQLALGVAAPVAILAASHLFGQRVRKKARYASRDEPYECGIAPAAGAPVAPPPRNVVQYYTTAMLFILFDVEMVFLVSWALSYRDLVIKQPGVVIPCILFGGVLAFGLFYEYRRGFLQWERPTARPAGTRSTISVSPAQEARLK